MKPKLQRIEIKAVRRRDDDFPIDDGSSRQPGEQQIVQLGKIAIERPQVPALDVDVIIAAENNRAKAIPFRLVQEALAGWKTVDELGQHRLDRRNDRG